MAQNAGNETLRLLEELRDILREDAAEMREGLDDLNARIDGLTHVVTLMAANMGEGERAETLEEALTERRPDRPV